MTISEKDRERIREEELVRLQVHTEKKFRQRPQHVLWGALWTAILAALAFVSRYFG